MERVMPPNSWIVHSSGRSEVHKYCSEPFVLRKLLLAVRIGHWRNTEEEEEDENGSFIENVPMNLWHLAVMKGTLLSSYGSIIEVRSLVKNSDSEPFRTPLGLEAVAARCPSGIKNCRLWNKWTHFLCEILPFHRSFVFSKWRYFLLRDSVSSPNC